MDDHTLLRNPGVLDANIDVAAAQPGARGHGEWLIDEGVEESFPASDSPSHSQPGSVAQQRNAIGRVRLSRVAQLAIAGGAAAVIALLARRATRR